MSETKIFVTLMQLYTNRYKIKLKMKQRKKLFLEILNKQLFSKRNRNKIGTIFHQILELNKN